MGGDVSKNSFEYVRANNALHSLWGVNHGEFLGGGTNLVDLMREGIEKPQTLIDINRLPLTEIAELPDGGLRVGEMVRNNHLAAHATVRERFPMLSEADGFNRIHAILGASPGCVATHPSDMCVALAAA